MAEITAASPFARRCYAGRVIHDASLDDLCQKVWAGGRIDAAEALRLYALPLEELGALADRRRQLHRAAAHGGHGADTITYIVDRNVNYTNVCNVYCKFCAFWRAEKDADAYVISHAEMDRKIEETIALGGTQILMQGGHHPKLTKQWYLDLLTHIREKFPGFNVHGFSPSEMVAFSEFFHEPVEQILKDFVAAGLGSVPGGGGEILVDRVRNRIAPLKASATEWMGVMDTAHRLGLATRGLYRILLKAAGRAAHSSFPELGESAIDKLIDVLMDLRRVQWPDDDLLGRTHYTVGLISGGVAPNVVPPHAQAELTFRTVHDASGILDILRRFESRVTLEPIFEVPPVRLATVEGIETAVFPYTTDIPFLSAWGRPLLFGPGSIHVAHTSDEFLDIGEQQQAVEAYVSIARQLLAVPHD